MEDPNSPAKTSALPIPIDNLWVLSLILGVVAYVGGRDVSLESERPSAGNAPYCEPKPPCAPEFPGTHARLWEDPLMVAYDDDRERKNNAAAGILHFVDPDHMAKLRRAIARFLPFETSLQANFSALQKVGRNLSLMPVMVPGEPYGETREMRLRMQYAIMTALSQSGYELALPTRMSYVTVPIDTRIAILDSDVSTELVIPVKLFLPSEHNSRKPAILVCWINEAQLGDQPLWAISQILDEFFTRQKQESLGLAIIGPSSSDMLDKMIHEKPKAGHRFSGGRFRNWPQTGAAPSVYSPVATMSYDQRADSAPQSPLRCGLKLVRTVGDDGQLVDALLDELALRGRWPSGGSGQVKQHIVLVYESDTLYGRKICDSLRTKMQPMGKGNLHAFSYLRGIDGKLPSDSVTDKAVPRAGESREAGKPSDDRLPEGRAQSDYLLRLAAQIEGLQRSGNDITAIGVVGTDFYDKLLILRALRGRFPGATFFTTGLEAGYSHPKEYQHTRNLVVASHFGLELKDTLQGSAPAFRDCSQTAIVFSVLLANGDLQSRSDPVDVGDDPWGIVNHGKQLLTPLIFEIGRNGPVRLRSDADAGASAHELDSKVHPLEAVSSRTLNLQTVVFGTIAVLLSLICIAFYKPGIFGIFSFVLDAGRVLRTATWHPFHVGQIARPMAACVTIVLTFALIGVALYANGVAAQEHFALGDGISTWPSTFIRFGTFLFCVVAGYYYCRKLDNNLTGIRQRYFDKKAPEKATVGKLAWLFWGTWPISDLLRSDSQRSDENPVVAVFERYASVEVWWRRVLRIFVPTVLFIFFSIMLFRATGESPNLPFRGTIAAFAGEKILFLSGVAMTAVLFLVLDATLFCRRFIRRLSDAEGLWPSVGINRMLDSISGSRSARMRLEREYLKELLIIRTIADRTRVVGRLIYLPCIALLLMFLARHPLLGNWSYPPPLLLVYGIILLGASYASYMLHRDAEQARTDVLRRLRKRLLGTVAMEEDHAAELRLVIRQIEHEKDGAFAPFSSSPVLNAWAVPVGGVSIIAMLDRVGTGWF